MRPHTAYPLVALALVWVAGCVEINGGAVELSWTLRTFAGANIDECSAYEIGQIRLEWQSGPDNPNVDGGSTTFDCTDSRGVTDFVIGEGAQLLEIVPICDDGNDAAADTYEVPAPILRQVHTGELVTLNSLLVVVGCRDANLCTCGVTPDN